jgi:asparagine synthase (glutamine-hydrolysing)
MAWMGRLDGALTGPATLASLSALSGSYSLLAGGDEGLLLARSSMGGCSLFFSQHHDEVLACSRMAPLLAALPDRPKGRASCLAAIVAGVPLPTIAETPFRYVSRLAPCEALGFGPGGRERLEQPLPELSQLDGLGAEELARWLWDEVRAAVRRSIKGKKRVGVLTGGGVDSSGVLAAAIAEARGASPKEVFAVTLDFASAGDDRPYMRDLAAALDIIPVHVRPRAGAAFLRSALIMDERPYQTPAGPLDELMARAAVEHGADVVLTGTWADELLYGDQRIRALEFLRRPLRTLRGAARMHVPWKSSARERVVSWIVQPLVRPIIPRGVLRRRHARRDAEQRWLGPRGHAELARVSEASSAPAPFHRSPAQRLRRFATSALACEVADGHGQLNAVTGCVQVDPFGDPDLVAFISRIPPMMLSHGDQFRGLLRLALKGAVPDTVRTRPDKAWFEPAFAEVLEAGGGLDAFGDLVAARTLAREGIVNEPEFRAIVRRLVAAPASQGSSRLWGPVWQVLAGEAFAQRFGVEA